MWRLAIDIGGTFTDAVVVDDESGQILLTKVPSTPSDYSKGLMQSIERARVDFRSIHFFAHGTTVCLNALIQGLLEPTALITTKGFKDIIDIGRGNRVQIYDPFYKSPLPLVPRRRRLEIDERTLANGSVLKSVSNSELEDVVKEVLTLGVKSIAIFLLHSYVNNQNELLVKETLEKKDSELFVTASSEISHEYHDYARACTTILNSGLMPIMRSYLTSIEKEIANRGFTQQLHIMQSNGGMATSKIAKRQPAYTINSGLVGGILAVKALSNILSIQNLIGSDMGGTSFDVELVTNGDYQMQQQTIVKTPFSGHDGYPVLFPTVDVHAIGAGGGSIAWIDEGGALHVGPRSAAADPGPACYGRGGMEPTVTDANLVLGRLNVSNFLGGTMKVYPERSEAVMKKVTEHFDMDVYNAASGILKIIISNMAGAIETMTIKRGIDPREYSMVSFGGAGPLHAVAIARELKIPEVIVSTMPGNFSAWGMLMADIKHDYVQTLIKRLDLIEEKEVDKIFAETEATALGTLSEESLSDQKIQLIRALDIRYLGQGHGLTIPLSSSVKFSDSEKARVEKSFDQMYLRLYLHNAPSEAKEIVALRVTALGIGSKPKLPRIREGDIDPPHNAIKGVREVYMENGFEKCRIIDRNRLHYRNRIEGPVVIEENTSTTLVWAGQQATIDEYGHIRVKVAA
jgi:N-methylhydantoinase A